jgi:GNAT superfamily N-acetyltransferase
MTSRERLLAGSRRGPTGPVGVRPRRGRRGRARARLLRPWRGQTPAWPFGRRRRPARAATSRSPGTITPVIRAATADDLPFLRAMLFEAADWRAVMPRQGIEVTLALPEVGRYVEGWGREGDAGVVAVEGRRRVGAAWYRLFPASLPGYGFVDERTPELTIGVLPSERGKGVGTALLRALVENARTAGFERMSLSVEPDNPALRLYERAGFVRIGGSGPGRWSPSSRSGSPGRGRRARSPRSVGGARRRRAGRAR